MLKDIEPASDLRWPTSGDSQSAGTVAGDYLYFANAAGQLYRTDGTGTGTVLLRTGTFPVAQTVLNNKFYFILQSPTIGWQLWTSNGTSAGTVLVANVGMETMDATINGVVYGSGYDSTNGSEVWRTDGTAAGTYVISDLIAGASNGAPAGLTAVGNTLYFFQAPTSGGNPTLYKTDGTAAGTTLVQTGVGYYLGDGVGASGGKLFFAGGRYSAAGEELWVSDGTAAGTGIVKDLMPGSNNSYPGSFVDLNGILLFWAAAPGSNNNYRLYRSDGTAAGTHLLDTVYPSWTGSPQYSDWLRVGDVYYIPTLGGLWRTDGTNLGTYQVVSVGDPQQFTNLGGALVFPATDSVHGYELWRYTPDESLAGSAFVDANADGVAEAGEVGLAGATVFLDSNGNGVPDAGEFTCISDSTGHYVFPTLPGATYTVREVPPDGYGLNGYATAVNVPAGQNVAGPKLANVPFSAVTFDSTYLATLKQHMGQSGTFLTGDVTADGWVAGDDLVVAQENFGHSLGSIIRGTPGTDAILLFQDPDHAHLDWIIGRTRGQLAASGGNGVTVLGKGGSDVLTFNYANGNPLPAAMHFNGTFTVNGLQTANPLANTSVDVGQSTMYFSYAGGASPVSAIRSALKAGYNAGGWNGAAGSGGAVVSAPAAFGAAGLYGVGYADWTDGVVAGQPANTVEVRYTVMGDANLDRVVNSADSIAMARNYLLPGKTAWDLGNSNYDEAIDFTDATIVRQNYNLTASESVAPAFAPAPVAVNVTTGASSAEIPGGGASGIVDSTAAAPKRHRHHPTAPKAKKK